MRSLLHKVLINPACAEQFTPSEWNLLVQQGYSTGLLARINNGLATSNINIPEQPKQHFESAQKKASAHADDVKIEIMQIIQALKPAHITPVFLKGAAYIINKDLAASGRYFSDIDIFVPKRELASAEQFLKWQGWQQEPLDEYDDNYYRKWMHEIPALIHSKRGTALDMHHNLLPLIGRFSIDSAILEENIKEGSLTLSPVDRFLHSTVHLFCGGEFENGCRDLSDLDLMIRQFSENDNAFWEELINRAQKLGVFRLLFYSLRYCKWHFQTPIPNDVIESTTKASPNSFCLAIMDGLFDRALAPHHSSCKRPLSGLANTALLIRSHWLKMPLTILIPHLFRKAVLNPIKNRNKAMEELTGK